MENNKNRLLNELDACLDIILSSPEPSGPPKAVLNRYAVLLQNFNKLPPDNATQNFIIKCFHRIFTSRCRFPYFWIDELELLTQKTIMKD